MDEKNIPQANENADETHQDEAVSGERRDAIAKLAYMSPVIAGLLFSSRSADAFSPPAPPG